MNKYHAAISIFILLVLLAPSKALSRSDYYDPEEQKKYSDFERKGFKIIESFSGSIQDTKTYKFNLPAGMYHVYVEGKWRIKDLDLEIRNDRRAILDYDRLPNSHAQGKFNLAKRQEITVEIEVFQFERFARSGEFYFILASEDRMQPPYFRKIPKENIYRYKDDYWSNWDEEGEDCPERRLVQERLEGLIESAIEDGYQIEMTRIGVTNSSRTYSTILNPGRYRLWAAGGLGVNDIDIEIRDSEGWSIESDMSSGIDTDLQFELEHPEDIQIEVEMWSLDFGTKQAYFCLLLCREDKKEKGQMEKYLN